MGIECQLLLTPPADGIYRSGDTVTGTLKYSLNKQSTFASVLLQLKGKGKCSWSEDDGDDSRTTYSGKEIYIDSQRNVLEGKTYYTVEAGDYVYPFKYTLPEKLPSSFHDSTCTIAYKVIATFSKSGISFSGPKVFDREIPLKCYVEPCSRQVIFGLTKSPFSLTSTKSVDLKIQIEKTLVMPGENIHLSFTLKNDSNIPVKGIEAVLIAKTTYISDSKRKNKRTKKLDKTNVKYPGSTPNSETSFTMNVPTLSNLYSIQHSRILINEYKLNVTAKFPFPHRNASVEIPVVIGQGYKKIEERMNFEQTEYIDEGVSDYDDGYLMS